MKRLKFYRVENDKQWGMYRADHCPDAIYCMQDTRSRHPHWYSDSRLKEQCDVFGVDPNTRDWRFGFKSPEQLKFWIYEDQWRENIDAHGFRVSVLEAEGFHGDTQGVFLASTRVDIKALSLMEI